MWWCISLLEKGAGLLTPPSGREKTQEACTWISPNCLMCLFPLLIILRILEYHWLRVLWVLLVISQTCGSSWEHKIHKEQNKIANKTSQRRKGKNSKTETYFSGLSGNLIRNSWFLYDLFSNVRIIFFTELSSNGSSWGKETNATISVQRDFLFTNHYFFPVALTCHSAPHLSGLTVQ